MWTTAIGMLGVGLLAALWLSTQLAWRRLFPAAGEDPDALAGRMGCHGCDSRNTCTRGPGAFPDGDEETP